MRHLNREEIEREREKTKERDRNDEAFFAKPSRETRCGTVKSSLDGQSDLARRRYGVGGMYVHVYKERKICREKGVMCIPKILRNDIRGEGKDERGRVR